MEKTATVAAVAAIDTGEEVATFFPFPFSVLFQVATFLAPSFPAFRPRGLFSLCTKEVASSNQFFF